MNHFQHAGGRCALERGSRTGRACWYACSKTRESHEASRGTFRRRSSDAVVSVRRVRIEGRNRKRKRRWKLKPKPGLLMLLARHGIEYQVQRYCIPAREFSHFPTPE